MNNYLQSLPFQSDKRRLTSCYCPGQGFDPPKFKMYTAMDRLPTFSLRLPPRGVTPDRTYGYECVKIYDPENNLIKILSPTAIGISLFKDSSSYFLTYMGGVIDGLHLECGKCYRINIDDYWSELFWATDALDCKVKIEFSNKSQLGDVPYQVEGFKQIIYVDGEMCPTIPELFENRKTENNGRETITFQRMTHKKLVNLEGLPDYTTQLLGSIPLHESVIASFKGEEIMSLKRRSKVSTTQNDCCDYTAELTLVVRDIEIIGGACQSDADGELVPIELTPGEVECVDDSIWTPTNETLCLRIGEVPKIETPPITPVGTPPVQPGCPPYGHEVSRQVTSVTCTSPWMNEGVPWKKKIVKQIADGSCGVNTVTEYVERCESLPPVGAPPVGTPPVAPPPTGSPCSCGLKVMTIENITKLGLDYSFDSCSTTQISWRIKQAGNIVRWGIDTVDGPNSSVEFSPALPTGDYIFEIEGYNCTSLTTSKPFSIAAQNADCPKILGINGFSGTAQPGQFGYLAMVNANDYIDIVANVITAGLYLFSFESSSDYGYQGLSNITAGGTTKSRYSNVGNGYDQYSWTDGTFVYLQAGNNTIRLSGTDNATFRVRNTRIDCIAATEGCNNVAKFAYQYSPGTSSLLLYAKSTDQVFVTLLKLISGSWQVVFAEVALQGTNIADFTGAYMRSGVQPGQFRVLYRAASESGCTKTFTLTTTSGNRVYLKGSAEGLTPCAEGPTLLSITSVSTTGLKFKFHGVNVAAIQWRIIQGADNQIDTDVINPTWNTEAIVFNNPLTENQTYTLQIEGSSCSSNLSTMSFTVPGPGAPPPPTVPLSGLSLTGQSGSVVVASLPISGGSYPLPITWSILEKFGFGSDTYNRLKVELWVKISGVFVKLSWSPGLAYDGIDLILNASFTGPSNTNIFLHKGNRNFYVDTTPFDIDQPGEYKMKVTAKMNNTELSSKETTFTLYSVNTNPLRFTVAPKNLFNLTNSGGLYTDSTSGDYDSGGQTFRNYNMRTYRAFYWVNEIPLMDVDGKPISFKNVPLVNGLTVNVRKVYVATAWAGAHTGESPIVTFEDFKAQGGKTWYEWEGADIDGTYRTVSLNFTTAGGANLVGGVVSFKQNPGWLDAGKLVPQYYFNPTPVLPDKPVGVQCFPREADIVTRAGKERSFQKLFAAGVTHIWYMNYQSLVLQPDNNPAVELHGINYAQMLGTQGLGVMFGLGQWQQLTRSQARQWADTIQLKEGIVITDEFAEGSFPQYGESPIWFYERLNERIIAGGFIKIQLLGEYGVGSIKLPFAKTHTDTTSEPDDPLFLALTGNKAAQLAAITPDLGSSFQVWKDTLLYHSTIKGHNVSGYYSLPTSGYGLEIGKYIVNYLFNAIVQNNGVQMAMGVFTWVGMQSNYVMADVPQRDSGTIMPAGSRNGDVVYHFPDTPAELMKFLSWFSLTFFDSVYTWDGYGNLNAHDERDGWYSSSLGIDCYMLGTRWYSESIAALTETGRIISALDYIVDGVHVNSSTVERRISTAEVQWPNNTYFNERAANQQGFLMVIPSAQPIFIWMNPYKSPSELETVVAKYNGNEYNLGQQPGMTLRVSNPMI